MATKEAQREYQKLWVARRRADWFKNKSCALCGSQENLELDHIDPSTKVHHAVWSWSEQRRSAELAKCRHLCAVCHMEKTKNDLRKMDVLAYLRRSDPEGTAWCSGCQEWFPVEHFNKNRSKRRGVGNYCRSCVRVRNSKRGTKGRQAALSGCNPEIRKDVAGSTPAVPTTFVLGLLRGRVELVPR